MHHFIQLRHLIHGFSIEVNLTGMGNVGSNKPVTSHQRGVGIVGARTARWEFWLSIHFPRKVSSSLPAQLR